jgi:Fe-S cluster assembly ATP-binding protein
VLSTWCKAFCGGRPGAIRAVVAKAGGHGYDLNDTFFAGDALRSPAEERHHLAVLELKDLHVALEDGTPIVKGVNLKVGADEVHAIMGPNGSGKSTLAYAIAGHPAYEITGGQILLDGEDLTEAEADERAQKGLFLAFQYPHAIPGVTVTNFLRTAINAIRKARAGDDDPIPVKEFRTELFAQMDRLKVSRELASRYLNDGFSGGEKKRVEILQLAMLKPRLAVLDETDSGLDIDALKVVAAGVKELVSPQMGALVITHYQRILNYIQPDFVHVFVDGRIVEEGGPELAHKLEETGYEQWEPSRNGSQNGNTPGADSEEND